MNTFKHKKTMIVSLLGVILLLLIFIPLNKRQYYRTELGYTFTIWGDYIVWGQKYKSLQRPQQDYIFIDRSLLPKGIELYLYVVSDSVLCMDTHGLEVVQALSSNYRIEFISDDNKEELTECLSNCTSEIILKDFYCSLWSVLSPRIVESKNGIKTSIHYYPQKTGIIGLWDPNFKRKLQMLTL